MNNNKNLTEKLNKHINEVQGGVICPYCNKKVTHNDIVGDLTYKEVAEDLIPQIEDTLDKFAPGKSDSVSVDLTCPYCKKEFEGIIHFTLKNVETREYE